MSQIPKTLNIFSVHTSMYVNRHITRFYILLAAHPPIISSKHINYLPPELALPQKNCEHECLHSLSCFLKTLWNKDSWLQISYKSKLYAWNFRKNTATLSASKPELKIFFLSSCSPDSIGTIHSILDIVSYWILIFSNLLTVWKNV